MSPDETAETPRTRRLRRGISGWSDRKKRSHLVSNKSRPLRRLCDLRDFAVHDHVGPHRRHEVRGLAAVFYLGDHMGLLGPLHQHGPPEIGRGAGADEAFHESQRELQGSSRSAARDDRSVHDNATLDV